MNKEPTDTAPAINPETVAFAGWNNNLRLSNGLVDLVVTLEVGPRIIRFGRVDGPNLFKTFASQCGQVGGPEWLNYGGHRLWMAPEHMPLTYYPDNHPVAHAWDGTTLVLTPPEQTTNRLQFAMEVTLDPARPRVTVLHRITNRGAQPVALAPWCLSVMAPGGRMVMPQEAFVPHGESYAPARPLVLWKFARMNDPRFRWGEHFVQLRQDDAIPTKTKIGAGNTKGWAAYLLEGEVFITYFPHDAEATYPDMGCNCEFYTEPGFLEVESLGPLTTLAPGEAVTHTEVWQLEAAELSEDEQELRDRLVPLVERNRS